MLAHWEHPRAEPGGAQALEALLRAVGEALSMMALQVSGRLMKGEAVVGLVWVGLAG